MVLSVVGQGSTRRGAEKTEAILAGALQEFLAQGYTATSVDRIAAAAGVSKATVYSHFGDKEALFEALVLHFVRERLPALLGPERATVFVGEPAEVLRRLAIAIVDGVPQGAEPLAFMRLIIGEAERFPALAQTFLAAVHKPIVEGLGNYLAGRAELRLHDPEAVARVAFGAILAFALVQKLLHGGEILPLSRERLIDSIVALITGTAHAR